MLFHSLQFILFFVVIAVANAALINVFNAVTVRKWLLLLASAIFYVTWSLPLFSLLLGCIFFNYYCALRIHEDTEYKRSWMHGSVVVNLGILATFKYLNFGIESAQDLVALFGFQINPGTFEIILPLGISFYTFQSLGYVIDVYRGRYKPYTSLTDFSLFVSFFPQLVAGPIVRADYFLKSLYSSVSAISWKTFNSGLILFTLGLFKKTVLADNASHVSNLVFSDPASVAALLTLLGVLAFAAQIYFDFSGYTDMARGLGRILGIELPENFTRPYIAVGLRDFWKRWHISLSTWLRDYLYISLGGSRAGRLRTYRNLFITMLLGGLWHGASLNFVIWGGIHGGLLTIEHYFSQTTWFGRLSKYSGQMGRFLGWLITFVVVCIAWVFFRAQDFSTATQILSNLTSLEGYLVTAELGYFKIQNWFFAIIVPYFYIFVLERYPMADIASGRSFLRAVYFCSILYLTFLVAGKSNEFIYFQF